MREGLRGAVEGRVIACDHGIAGPARSAARSHAVPRFRVAHKPHVSIWKERAARNEALFRAVNEEIHDIDRRFGFRASAFVCECADDKCVVRLSVPPDVYTAARESPTRFSSRPGTRIPRSRASSSAATASSSWRSSAPRRRSQNGTTPAAADRGGRAALPCPRAPVAQRTERRPSKPRVAGSNPARRVAQRAGAPRLIAEAANPMGFLRPQLLDTYVCG
jgi:hypothetical protein